MILFAQIQLFHSPPDKLVTSPEQYGILCNTVFTYKCTNIYNKESEGSILWSDPDINIDWNIENPILSEKDKTSPLFKDFETPFK